MLASFYERFPVHENDVLGARFHAATTFAGYTAAYFGTANAADEIAVTPALAAGASFTGSSNATKDKVNMEAYLEPDEDHDGYGDVSQDLCPGSPIGGAACSGSLVGTNFEGVAANSGGAGSDSLYVQTALGGASASLPARGVVVRWRVLGVPTFAREFQLRVLAPNGSSGYTVARSSAAETLPKNTSAEAGAIGSFPTRLPVPAGGYVGIATDPTFTTPAVVAGPPGTTMSKLADGADGTTYGSLPTTATSVVGYDADIEPDGDGDGYGDVTQDACPQAASTQVAPCPQPAAAASSGGGGSGPPPTSKPKSSISGFKVVPKAFHIKAHGGGTKLKLTLSQPAKVTFKIEQRLLCSSKAGAAARCKAGFHVLGSFSKQLPMGSSKVPFTGRLKGKSLVVGSYRVSATAAAAPARATFTVLP
jgi:hypothetical protein